MHDEEIRRLTDPNYDGAEAWGRMLDDQIRAVEVLRHDDDEWSVILSVAEFLREEPLESEMRVGMDRALRAVPGVTDVREEDREDWVVTGRPHGAELVRAAATVVDALADRARAHLDFY